MSLSTSAHSSWLVVDERCYTFLFCQVRRKYTTRARLKAGIKEAKRTDLNINNAKIMWQEIQNIISYEGRSSHIVLTATVSKNPTESKYE